MTFQQVSPGLHLWRFMMHEIEMSIKNLIKSLISYHVMDVV